MDSWANADAAMRGPGRCDSGSVMHKATVSSVGAGWCDEDDVGDDVDVDGVRETTYRSVAGSCWPCRTMGPLAGYVTVTWELSKYTPHPCLHNCGTEMRLNVSSLKMSA